MNTIIKIMEDYGEFIKIGAAGLVALILLIVLVKILSQIKKLNKSLKSITTNMDAYFNVILTEEEEGEEGSEMEEPEERIRAKVEELRKQEEDEKVFNAVLQEYFS